jgi:hypothetical protein
LFNLNIYSLSAPHCLSADEQNCAALDLTAVFKRMGSCKMPIARYQIRAVDEAAVMAEEQSFEKESPQLSPATVKG